MSRLVCVLKYMVALCLGVILISGGLVFWLFDRSMPDYAGQVSMTGLGAETRVYTDSHGVPHIFARSRNDAARALGYVHASERIVQMELQRRAGQGRLSEIIGPTMLGVDKYIRTLGLYGLAQSSAKAMSPEAQEFFQAYADGVNRWLEIHKTSLPPEFIILHDTPEPWQPADSVVWGKLMALQLSHNYKLEMLRATLANTISAANIAQLFPMPPEESPVTTRPLSLQKTDRGDGVPDVLEQLGHITSLEHGASNEWVIAGSRTESGKPILANDPHLGLEAPILWYLARLVTPEGSVKGATVPGLPIVLLGQNDHIAWGFTTTGSDVQDLFVETVDSQNAEAYLTPKGAIAFATRTEVIHVKGSQDVVLKVRRTRHGPVMSDVDEDMAKLAGNGKVMALAFTGLDDHDRTSEALMHLNWAENWQGFREALKLYQAPPQNVVYADIEGNIGFINPGLMPIRKQGNGMTPADGASGTFDWVGMVPFEELPQLYNPKVGFIFNANNAVVNARAPHFYGTDWEEPYRAVRLQYFFNTLDHHTLDSSARMQADHVSLAARDLLPFLGRIQSKNASVIQTVDMLRQWDGEMDKDRPEPLLFEAWLYQLHRNMLVAKTGNDLKDMGPYSATTIVALLKNNPDTWCDGDKTCASLLTKSMEDAVGMLSARERGPLTAWRWGRENISQIKHKIYSHVPVLGAWSDLSVPSSGDFYTLDRGGSFDFDPAHPFARTHAGGFRGIYDLSNPSQSRFMITTGESGHIFSRHYGDFVALWNDVKSFTLSGSAEELAAEGLPKLILKPLSP